MRRGESVRAWMLGLLCVVAWLVAAAPVLAAQRRVAVGSVQAVPARAHVIASLPAMARLRLDVALTPRDPFGLKTFATAVSTPGTPQYGHYLSVGQFARRFGATPAHVAAVAAALRRAGLDVEPPNRNDLMLPVSGDVAAVQRAFETREASVRLPDGRSAYVNRAAPRLPADIASDVDAVIGLQTVQRDQPRSYGSRSSVRSAARQRPAAVGRARAHALTNGPVPCPDVTAQAQTNNAYTSDEIAAAYGFNGFYQGGDEGQGQTVAVLELQPLTLSDVASFQSCYQTHAQVTQVQVQGGAPSADGDDGEAAGDVEQIIGLAPQASVLDYEGPTLAPTLSQIVSDKRASVVSISWGDCETIVGAQEQSIESQLLQQAAAEGMSVFAAAGDNGSEDCYEPPTQTTDTSLAVDDPSSQPFITGVGGTTLCALNTTANTCAVPDNGTYSDESVWNDGYQITNGTISNTASATGGGSSATWTAPAYQANAANSLGVDYSESSNACNGLCREVPDVSADASRNTGYEFYDFGGTTQAGWDDISGTSMAAPLWAAVIAVTDALPACRGHHVGFANPDLYALGGSDYASAFHDVAAASPFTGEDNNDAFADGFTSPDTKHYYHVFQAYDMTTGLGSPQAGNLGSALCGLASPVYTVTLNTPGPQTTTQGAPTSLQIAGSDSGNQPLSYSATGLPAGLTMSATGAISGTPTTVGTSTVSVTATDGPGNTNAITFTWTIAKPPVLVVPHAGRPRTHAVRIFGLLKRKPKLTLEIIAGSHAPAIKAIALALPRSMSFANSTRTLRRGIVLSTSTGRLKFTVTLRRKVLTLTLRKAAQSFYVRITRPAISITAKAAKQIRREKLTKLQFSLALTDAKGKQTRTSVTLHKLLN
jgi:subtilase family serine protease